MEFQVSGCTQGFSTSGVISGQE